MSEICVVLALSLFQVDIESSILIEELKIIASAITDIDHKSNQVKQWCITLWTAAWGLIGIKHLSDWLIGPLFYVLVLIIPLVFLVLDIQVKRNQRKFLWRAKELHGWINGITVDRDKNESNSDETVPAIRLYAPAGANTVKFQNQKEYTDKYEKSISAKESFMKSHTLKVFYLGLVSISLFGVILLLYKRG